jgi:hypothetical protein
MNGRSEKKVRQEKGKLAIGGEWVRQTSQNISGNKSESLSTGSLLSSYTLDAPSLTASIPYSHRVLQFLGPFQVCAQPFDWHLF